MASTILRGFRVGCVRATPDIWLRGAGSARVCADHRSERNHHDNDNDDPSGGASRAGDKVHGDNHYHDRFCGEEN